MVFAEFVITYGVPRVQFGLTVEVLVIPPEVKTPNDRAEAVTEHVPATLPEAEIDPEAVSAWAGTANVLYVEPKSNIEKTSNVFFVLFLIIFLVSWLERGKIS